MKTFNQSEKLLDHILSTLMPENGDMTGMNDSGVLVRRIWLPTDIPATSLASRPIFTKWQSSLLLLKETNE